MRRPFTALILALAFLLTAALPPALADSDSVTAHTPLPGDDDKLSNLRLAVQALDGIRVPHGESFSFNESVGPRTRQRGYVTAPNGRGAPVTGGGVAQAASTLYLALLKLDDVDIDPVKTYGSRYIDDYVQDPDYAIITDYDADIDLSFTNWGEALSIDMWLGRDALWCVLTTGGQDFGFPDSDTFMPIGDALDESYSASGGALGGETYSASGGALGGETFQASGGAIGGETFQASGGAIGGDSDGGMFLEPNLPASSRGLLSASSIDCGGDSAVIRNVTLAADSVTDTVLERNDIFSFNDVVGPRTEKYGYRRAVNGRGKRVTGGGVAQVASALWLAVKDLDDIVIVEKSTYGDKYNQDYVRSSADAIVTDYSSGRDFAFRYTGRGSITLYTWVDDGRLYCEIYEN